MIKGALQLGFLSVRSFMFPPISQKHSCRLIGYFELSLDINLCVCAWCPVM